MVALIWPHWGLLSILWFLYITPRRTGWTPIYIPEADFSSFLLKGKRNYLPTGRQEPLKPERKFPPPADKPATLRYAYFFISFEAKRGRSPVDCGPGLRDAWSLEGNFCFVSLRRTAVKFDASCSFSTLPHKPKLRRNALTHHLPLFLNRLRFLFFEKNRFNFR